MNEDVLQSIMRGVAQHHPQSFHSGSAEIFCAGQLSGTVIGELRQQPSRVVFTIHAVGRGVSRNFGQRISESEREIPITVVAIAVQETVDSVDVETRIG